MQTIRTYMNSVEAEMDRQLLENCGIQAESVEQIKYAIEEIAKSI